MRAAFKASVGINEKYLQEMDMPEKTVELLEKMGGIQAFGRWEDLTAFCEEWLKEAEKNKEEYNNRLSSDYLCYCDHAGLYADFHTAYTGIFVFSNKNN
jgi:hypothetical protein